MSQIFIVGNSRSGTTLMGRILGAHSKVFTFHELHFYEQLWSAKDHDQAIGQEEAIELYARLMKNQIRGYLTQSGHEEFHEVAAQIIRDDTNWSKIKVFKTFLEKITILEEKRVSCEQTPRNVLYLDEILSHFPDARIIAMVRDPRDVVLSQKNKWKRRFLGATNIPLKESIRSWVNYHAITISRLWIQNYRAIQKLAEHPAVLSVSYEALSSNPSAEITKICNFLRLNFEPGMTQIEVKGSSIASDSNARGIVKNSGKWKSGGLSQSEVYLCQKICENEMRDVGYKIDKIKPNPVQLTLTRIFFPLKLTFAFALNLHRIKNLQETISRRMIILKG